MKLTWGEALRDVTTTTINMNIIFKYDFKKFDRVAKNLRRTICQKTQHEIRLHVGVCESGRVCFARSANCECRHRRERNRLQRLCRYKCCCSNAKSNLTKFSFN